MSVFMQYFDCSRVKRDSIELAFFELHWLLDTHQISDSCQELNVFEHKDVLPEESYLLKERRLAVNSAIGTCSKSCFSQALVVRCLSEEGRTPPHVSKPLDVAGPKILANSTLR